MNKTRSIMTPIDGGDSRIAPPPQRGLMRAIYDTVEAIGFSDTQRISRYLPAAIKDANVLLSKKKLESALYSAVYHGYLIRSGDKYRVAPMSYYEARQQIIADHKANPKPPKAKRGEAAPPSANEVIFVRPFWHWAILALTGATSLLAGVLIGTFVP